jgi:hypothetical protein
MEMPFAAKPRQRLDITESRDAATMTGHAG